MGPVVMSARTPYFRVLAVGVRERESERCVCRRRGFHRHMAEDCQTNHRQVVNDAWHQKQIGVNLMKRHCMDRLRPVFRMMRC